MTFAYLILTVVGCGYVLLSLLLGHGDADAGGAEAGDGAEVSYGVDGEGHGHASATTGVSEFHFPFFSPLAMATFAGTLGGFGLVARHGFGASAMVSLGVAAALAFGATYAVTYAGWRLARGSRGTSTIRLEDLRGAAAEVITPIPLQGVGEVAAMVGGQRYTGPAREEQGREVPRGARVTVKELVGTTILVTKGES